MFGRRGRKRSGVVFVQQIHHFFATKGTNHNGEGFFPWVRTGQANNYVVKEPTRLTPNNLIVSLRVSCRTAVKKLIYDPHPAGFLSGVFTTLRDADRRSGFVNRGAVDADAVSTRGWISGGGV
jgi:hypothetical protein